MRNSSVPSGTQQLNWGLQGTMDQAPPTVLSSGFLWVTEAVQSRYSLMASWRIKLPYLRMGYPQSFRSVENMARIFLGGWSRGRELLLFSKTERDLFMAALNIIYILQYRKVSTNIQSGRFQKLQQQLSTIISTHFSTRCQLPNCPITILITQQPIQQYKQSRNINMREHSIAHSHGQQQQSAEPCYFCTEADIDKCVARSLYYKHNDIADKHLSLIESIVATASNSSKSLTKLMYEQVQYLIDDNEILGMYYRRDKASKDLEELLQYYKYRRFVPIFAKDSSNKTVTDSIYYYYYQRLKIYYNSIKRKLNMTIDGESKSEFDDQSLMSLSNRSMTSQSMLLGDLTPKISKETIRGYETESKALQGLITLLNENEYRLKNVKTLRTEDCCALDSNPFRDNRQNQSAVMMKKKKNTFFRFIQESKGNRIRISKQSLEALKNENSRSKSKNMNMNMNMNMNIRMGIVKLHEDKLHEGRDRDRDRNNSSNNKNKNRNKSSHKIVGQKSVRKLQECEQIAQKRNVIKSLPKVILDFQIRPSRSLSSISLKYHNKNRNSKALQQKQHVSPYQAVKIEPYESVTAGTAATQRKKRSSSIKRIKQIGVDINHDDNLASIRRKKLEELKIKSKRKKQLVK